MAGEKRFQPEKLDKLEGPRRQRLQPPGPVVELVVGLAPATVLDIGVGVGYFAFPLAKHMPGARVIGLDVEPKMLAELEDRMSGDSERAAAIEPLLAAADGGAPYPLPDKSVDVAIAINLVHELDDRAAFLAENLRVLVPGGWLLICDWDTDGREDFGPPADHRLGADILQDEISAAGFASTESHDLYPDLYSLLARAP